MRNPLLSHGLSLIGALIGGALGACIVYWLSGQGFYGMMVPGAMLGLGASLLARHRSAVRGIACGLAGLALGIYCEWRFFPFDADKSPRYFLSHIPDLRPTTFLMIGLGGFFAFWMGKDASAFSTAKEEPTGKDGPA